MKKILTIWFMSIVFSLFAQERTSSKNQSEELGKVSWYRDYDTALKLAQQENKPILILFQEVPGCMTCRNYGHNVLSHPLMIEAIENEFIPLAIFNNKTGKDRDILNLYNEPTWNNPVVRIVNSKGVDLVNRVARNYSSKALYEAMTKALKRKGKKIPKYIQVLGEEVTSQNITLKETYYKMYCFWSGEGFLGSIDGVVSTKAGFMNGEVVKVTYNPLKLSHETLQKLARTKNMTYVPKTNFRWSSPDEDYYIQHSSLKYIPLTEIQRTKINSAIINKEDPLSFLSPKQLKWLQHSEKKQVLFNKDFTATWNSLN